MRIRHMPWAIALVCVVLGFMLSMQFKVQQQVQLKDTTSLMRSQELAKQLEQAESERDALMSEVDDLRGQVTKMASASEEYSALAEQLSQAQIYASLIPMTGTGVTVDMRDSTLPAQPGENPNYFIIHDADVLQVINELRANKAEAISINGQRLTGRSEIHCAGPTIIINGVRTAPPIIIKAIGDPELLEEAIMMKDGVASQLAPFGIEIKVKKEQVVNVPAYKGSLKLQYATPATQEVGKP
jgi:uncharacterized protein YlxW (UPF0749 family)